METKCGLIPKKYSFFVWILLLRLMKQMCENAKQLQKIFSYPTRPWAQFFATLQSTNQIWRQGIGGKTNQSNMANIVKYVAWPSPASSLSIFSSQKLRRQYIANKMQIASKSFGGTT